MLFVGVNTTSGSDSKYIFFYFDFTLSVENCSELEADF